MIVPDVNLLVFAYNADAPLHAEARRWWEALLNADKPVGVPWAVALGFVRLMTHRVVLTSPLSPAQATARVRAWFAQPNVEPLEPGPRHLDLVDRFLAAAGTGGNLVTDAHIAALAAEHQGEVHSLDEDFGRFPGLRWRNPLS